MDYQKYMQGQGGAQKAKEPKEPEDSHGDGDGDSTPKMLFAVSPQVLAGSTDKGAGRTSSKRASSQGASSPHASSSTGSSTGSSTAQKPVDKEAAERQKEKDALRKELQEEQARLSDELQREKASLKKELQDEAQKEAPAQEGSKKSPDEASVNLAAKVDSDKLKSTRVRSFFLGVVPAMLAAVFAVGAVFRGMRQGAASTTVADDYLLQLEPPMAHV